ncbi:MAG: hypothetical protein GJ677_00855 [Rhodobacteraceae bacterium]|nr:hypothetical protein [Paracoccaceae bacterium]
MRFVLWVVAIVMAAWNAPEVYATGCSHWLELSRNAEILQAVCYYHLLN